MEPTSVIHSTFVIERTYPVTPGTRLRRLRRPGTERRWFITGTAARSRHYELDFRVAARNAPACASTRALPVAGKLAPPRPAIWRSCQTAASSSLRHWPSTGMYLRIPGHCRVPPSEDGTDVIFTHQGGFSRAQTVPHPDSAEGRMRKLLRPVNLVCPRRKAASTVSSAPGAIKRVAHRGEAQPRPSVGFQLAEPRKSLWPRGTAFTGARRTAGSSRAKRRAVRTRAHRTLGSRRRAMDLRPPLHLGTPSRRWPIC